MNVQVPGYNVNHVGKPDEVPASLPQPGPALDVRDLKSEPVGSTCAVCFSSLFLSLLFK